MVAIEDWRKIGGYDNYEVSDCGHVRNVKTGRTLTGGLCSTGYLSVALCKDGKAKSKNIHQLVASAFLGDSEGHQVDHKDRNKLNNNVSNLRYVSISDNLKNKTSSNGCVLEYLRELPPEAVIVERYGSHHFEDLYYYDTNFYFFNGVEYRKLTRCMDARSGYYYVQARDTNNRKRTINLAKYRRLIGEVD
jgi:hypothetical protein